MIALRIQNNVDLYLVGRSESNIIKNHNLFFKIDLLDKQRIKELVKKIVPDIIIHCAAQIPTSEIPDTLKLYNLNAQIDDIIFQAIRDTSCKIIYLSGTNVYGYPDFVLNIDESFPLNTSSYYAAQKIEAEQFILQNLSDGLILRLNAPYGLYMRTDTVLTKFIKLALLDLPIEVHGSGTRMQDFTNSRDIAELMYDLIISDNWESGVFNLATEKPISMKELSNLIVNITCSKSVIINSGITDKQENYKASYSVEKSKNILKWNPKITLENGIREIALSYKDK
jgi:nucleoside-diphosphate-sugar epimerase